MCKFFSAIIKRDGTILWDKNSNSNEDLIKKDGLSDDKLIDRDFVRVEYTQNDGCFSTKKGEWTYKEDEKKILCNLQESKIEVGSMVKILNNSPICCCPSKYDHNTNKGSFFCPAKDFEDRSGPFATKQMETEENINREKHGKDPICPSLSEDEDILMCHMNLGDYFDEIEKSVLTVISGTKDIVLTDMCTKIQKLSNGMYSSSLLDGTYTAQCPLGAAFQSCGLSASGASSRSDSSTDRCRGNDMAFNFWDKIGKVVRVPDEDNIYYTVTFNDGRTVYDFHAHELKLQKQHSNYELWFVHRNRYERVVQYRKDFKVIWPPCTFDVKNNRYIPFTLLSESGEILELFG
jgi:hypothetical protein